MNLPDLFTAHNREIDLGDGRTLRLVVERDEHHGAPWDEEYMHGPVSDWTRRGKRAGELVLCSRGGVRRYYDFAEAVRIARRDGWGLSPERKAELESNLGRALTPREVASLAAREDFDRLQAWCDNLWEYVGVIVTLHDEHGAPVADESLWGIESDTGYHLECANEIAARLVKENTPDPACHI